MIHLRQQTSISIRTCREKQRPMGALNTDKLDEKQRLIDRKFPTRMAIKATALDGINHSSLIVSSRNPFLARNQYRQSSESARSARSSSATMKLAFFALAVLAVLRSEAATVRNQRLVLPDDQTVRDLVSGIEKFSLTFLLRTAMDSKDDNIVVSPYSAWSVLTVMTRGARGTTLYEMSQALRHPKRQHYLLKKGLDLVEKAYMLDSYSVDIKAKNFIFTDLKVSKDFKNSISPTCKTYVISTKFDDPNAHNVINKEVSEATDGHLQSLVYKNDIADSQIVLANAMFFKTMWTQPFNALFTSKQPFHDYKNRKIGTVDMMMQRGRFKYAKMNDFQADVIELPIGHKDRMCMIVLMPHINVQLKTVYEKFVQFPIGKIFESLDAAKNHEHDVELQFPKFSTTTDIVLNKILNYMGIYDVFDPYNADLSGIVPVKNVSLSRIIHLARIDVTEGVVSDFVFEPQNRFYSQVPQFVVDRPFMYLIIEKETNVMVLGGTFKDPTAA